MTGAEPLVSWGDFFGNADLVTAYLGIITVAVTGFWGIKRYGDERRATREQQAETAKHDLDQRRHEALAARQQRAADLVKAVGDAPDARSRRWTMSALSLYPDESLDLLLATLGDASPEDAAAIKVAVISLGEKALPRVVKYHRIANQLCRIGDATGSDAGPDEAGQDDAGQDEADVRHVDGDAAARMRDCTREIVVHLLLQLDDERRPLADLAGVDLSAVDLSRTRLNGAPFRKVRLDGAVLGHARLRHANLRGASVAGTVLTRAILADADLTGAHGAVRAVRADLSDATLDRADLSGSTLDAARMQGASLHGTTLVKASMAGASLTGATLDRTRMTGAVAHHLSLRTAAATGLDARNADLAQARLDGARLENSTLQGASAPGLRARDGRLVNVNLNGVHLDGADLTGTELTGCVLNGTRLEGAALDRVVFRRCTFGSTRLTAATPAGAQFLGCHFTGNVDLTGTDLSTAVFADSEVDPGTRLVVDNQTWRDAGLDAALRDAVVMSSPAT